MKKEQVETEAMKIFNGKEMLVERPSGMPFDVYRTFLREQSKLIKRLFKTKPMRRVARMMPVNPGYNLH